MKVILVARVKENKNMDNKQFNLDNIEQEYKPLTKEEREQLNKVQMM